MHYINYWLSLIAVYLYRLHAPQVVVVTKTEIIEKLDPHGLAKNDMQYIEKHAAKIHWKAGDTVEDIAYRQGQQDLVTFIKTKILGRR